MLVGRQSESHKAVLANKGEPGDCVTLESITLNTIEVPVPQAPMVQVGSRYDFVLCKFKICPTSQFTTRQTRLGGHACSSHWIQQRLKERGCGCAADTNLLKGDT